MKTILTLFLCMICNIITNTYSFGNQSVQFGEVKSGIHKERSEVYEGTITGIRIFYGMSTQGLTPAGYYINLDTYPDSDFEFNLKNGLKWGLVEEIAPGLVIVNSEKCKGWYVNLTVNNSMQVTKCKILSYGDQSE